MIPTILLASQLLAQLSSDSPAPGGPVVVSLANGATIRGRFLAREGGSVRLGVERGELRLRAGRIHRMVEASSLVAPAAPGAAAPRALRVVRVPVAVARASSCNASGLDLEVPPAWREIRLPGRAIAFSDVTQDTVLGVSFLSGAQPLWSLTTRIKKEYARLYADFAPRRESFGSVAGTRIWELEFRYREGGGRFRQLQRFFDLGARIALVAFTVRDERFDAVAPKLTQALGRIVPYPPRVSGVTVPRSETRSAPRAPGDGRAEETPPERGVSKHGTRRE